jgi:hypothetical protein
MALAVAMKSRRRVSTDEKEVSRDFRRESGISVLAGERQLKKKWLLCAIEAWLKREAMVGLRAYLTRRDLGVLE